MPDEKPLTVAQVDWDIGGVKFTMTGACATPAEVHETLDHFRNAVWRQQAYVSLMLFLTELRQKEAELADKPREKGEKQKARALARAELVAQWQASHDASGKRAEFQLAGKHRQDLLNFDAETRTQLAQIEASETMLREVTIPGIEKSIKHQRMLVETGDRIQVLTELRGEPLHPFPEAAE